ncbi:MAG: hypothetical protein ACXVHM_01890 [Methanobacterium sp.]
MKRLIKDDSRISRGNILGNKTIIIGTLIILILAVGSLSFSPNPTPTVVSSSNISSNSNSNLNDLEVDPADASYIVVGNSYIKVPDNATVVTQADRVVRDKASHVRTNVPPDHRPTGATDLVPWMEGARVSELIKYADVNVIPATNVPIKKVGGRYFGPDDKGNFVFEVDPSKVGPLFSQKVNNDTWNMVDTHGMNILVPEAMKDHAYLAIACGDIKGKADAESYMAKNGINCYASCDRFTSSVMPYEGPGVILGGEPLRKLKSKSGAVIGAQPLYFSPKEKIVVQTTTKKYPDQYCDTPNRFFSNLQKAYNIKLNVDVVDASAGETNKVVDQAHKTGANVIGVRVMNDKDKKPVEDWLKENKDHKAILFHSASYGPGYSLFFEFPNQVTGQDPDPKFIKYASDSDLQNRFNSVKSLWQ